MKKMLFVLIFVVFDSIMTTANASDNDCFLYVNGTFIDKVNSEFVRIDNQISWLPLRTIFEGLGATVTWDALSGDTLISYKDESYTCFTDGPNPKTEFIYVKNDETNTLIFLNSMGYSGAYKIINDRIYIGADTCRRLLKGMGCSMEIENNIVKIYERMGT